MKKKIISFCALLLMCCATPWLSAQETKGEFSLRQEKMNSQELTIRDYISDKIDQPLPAGKMQEFAAFLQNLENPASQAGEVQLLQQFKRQYWRGEYFRQYPETKVVYQPMIVSGSCANGDFEDGDFSNYTGQTAYGANGYNSGDCNIMTPAIPDPIIFTNNDMSFVGDFAIVDSTAMDPYAPIERVNSGMFAARVNSDMDDTTWTQPNASVSKLIKRVVLSAPDEEIFFNYAPVLTDPGTTHDGEKPTFVARVLDVNGVECDRICHSAYTSDPFLLQSPTHSGVRYRDWSCASLDACGVPGDTVTLEFVATDCGQTAHWGYAYIDDICDTCSTDTTDPCNYEGSIELNPTDTCIGNTMQVTGSVDYAISNCDTAIIDSIRLTILQSGVDVTAGTIPVIWSGNNFSFTVTPANLPPGAITGDGFDFFVEVFFSFGPGVIHIESDYHSNPGQNNDYVYNAACCPEFDILTCCDLTGGSSLFVSQKAQDEMKAYRSNIAAKYPARSGSGDPCCNYCDYPDEEFPIFIYDENGMLIDNTVFTITWSHDPGNNSAISYVYPDSAVVVTVAGPDTCLWTETFLFECCDDPGLNGVCCDTVAFNLDVDSICTFDPCEFPNTQFPIVVLRDGVQIGTPAYSFAWSNGTSGSATSVTLNDLPITVVVTDNETGCSDSITYTINCGPCEIKAPRNLKCFNHRGQNLSWSSVPNAVSYQIAFSINDPRCCNNGQPGISTLPETVNDTTYYVSDPAKCFSWMVRAVCADGTLSDWSRIACSCGQCFITTPQDLKCNVTHGGQQLTWTAVLNATSYDVSIEENDPDCCGSSQRPTVTNVSVLSNSYFVSSTSKCFSWRVRARCSDGTLSAWSGKKCSCGFVIIQPGKQTSNGNTSNFANPDDFKVTAVPNPADEFVDITVIHNGDVADAQPRVVMTDMAGHEVHNSVITLNAQNRIELGDLTSGIYGYRIFYGEQMIYADKLVIK